MRDVIRSLILFVIELIERIEYIGMGLDENDTSKKILDTVDISGCGYKVMTESGWRDLTHVHKTQPYKVHELKTWVEGMCLHCADNHVVMTTEGARFVRDLRADDLLLSTKNPITVREVTVTHNKVSMYDVTVDSDNHTYYTNNLLSHNTVTAAIFLIWYALFHTDKNIGLLANKGETAKEVADKIKEILNRLPFYMKPGVMINNVFEMKFDNNCRLICQATTPRSFIGFTLHVLYCDEFAHVDSNVLDEFYENAMPTVSSMKSSKIIITSTPNGFNKFYELFTAAEKGENSYVPVRVDWWEHPDRDEAWHQKMIADIGEESFLRQYGNSFLATGGTLLSTESMSKIQNDRVKYVERDIDAIARYNKPETMSVRFHPQFDVEEFSNYENLFVTSNDLAEGGGGKSDYTVTQIMQVKLRDNFREILSDNLLDYIKLVQVGIMESNETHLRDFARIVYAFACYTCRASDNLKMVIELNTYGELFIQYMCMQDGDNNQFEDSLLVRYVHSGNNPDDKTKFKYGLKLGANKSALCQDCRKYVSTGQLEINEEETVKEFELFSKQGNSYKASRGHDDKAMSIIDACSLFTNESFKSAVDEWLSTKPEADVIANNIERYYEVYKNVGE